jgi:hypothetical protein
MTEPTTFNLGQQPGRARLGACGHRVVAAAAARPGNWRHAALAPFCTTTALTMGAYVGSNDQGFSIKRPARHLGEEST